MQQQYQPPYQYPQPQQYPAYMAGRSPAPDKLTELKVKPSWALAWGLLWRTFILVLPFYGLIYLLATVLRK